MGLYAVLNECGKPIAYHENKKVVKEFLQSIGKQNHIVVKVKHPKTIEKSSDYADLYLTKAGNQYIQAMYFDSLDILNSEELYSYDSLIEIIMRELEYNQDITKSERHHLEKTLKFFERRVEDIIDEPCDYETCKRHHDMREQMRFAISVDELKENDEY